MEAATVEVPSGHLAMVSHADEVVSLIEEDHAGDAWFTVDQPSKQFGSFAHPAITDVGIELDHKLGAVLDALGVPVPSSLTS
jgi:hypothetical protein